MHVYGIIDVYRTRAVHDVCARGSGGICPQGKFEFLGHIKWYVSVAILDHSRLILTCMQVEPSVW